ncbi:carbohydrate kinase family protein [Microvirga sp. GCM10011540]|uniref:carbohydrate kinase family protein n=1 Tax=Microvirga sp. GCM10011540 TaxID=3317338 RepID=UPI003610C439
MRPTGSKITCVGGAAVDRKLRSEASVVFGTSNPVRSERSFGGVARNVAENLARLGAQCSLMSLLGNDENGRLILHHLNQVRVDTSLILISEEYGTAEYTVVLQPDGNIALGLADMSIFGTFSPELLQRAWPELASSSWIFADCNLPAETIADLLSLKRHHSPMLAVDAVSKSKALHLPPDLRGIDALFLNSDEARSLLGQDSDDAFSAIEAAVSLRQRGAARVILTCGAAGLIAADELEVEFIRAEGTQVIDVTGAGDSLIAATLLGLMKGNPLAISARLGMVAARLTIEHSASVRPDLSLALLKASMPSIQNLILEQGFP